VFKGYNSEGVVLASKSYGEADRIIVIFTKVAGKLLFLAKGVRKPKSKKRGNLEVFSLVKFSARGNTGLDIITEAEMLYSFPKIRKDLKKCTLAYLMVEIMGRISSENDPNVKAYRLLINSLKSLEADGDLIVLKNDYMLAILTTFGYWDEKRTLRDPDALIKQVLEKDLTSVRVGKKVLS